MEKLNLSNKNVYAGSGFMRSNITNEFRSKLEKITNQSQGNSNINSEINLLEKKDLIDTGFLYYRKFKSHYGNSIDSSLIYKYGSRRMKLRLPTVTESDNVWVSVLMPDVLVARSSKVSSVYLGFANFSRLWPFHNTYSSYGHLSDFMSNATINQITGTTNNIKTFVLRHYLDRFCLGESVSGIDLEKTPELYTHTLLTSISNYDLSCNYSLHPFITDNYYHNFKNLMMDKVIDLSKVSNLFKGYLHSNDLLDCTTLDDIINLLNKHVDKNIDDKLAGYYHDYDTAFESITRNRRESANLIVIGLLSAFGNVELVEEAIKNRKD